MDDFTIKIITIKVFVNQITLLENQLIYVLNSN